MCICKKKKKKEKEVSIWTPNTAYEKWASDIWKKGIAGLKAEFKTIEKWTPENATFTAATANNDTSPHKCQDRGRVSMDHTNGAYPYYSANRVQIDKESFNLICASQPTKETAAAFWAMLVKHDNTVYAFNNCFCPTNENKTVTFGQPPNVIKVTFNKEFTYEEEGIYDEAEHTCKRVLVTVESPFGPPKQVKVRDIVGFEGADYYIHGGRDYNEENMKDKQLFIVANDAGYGSMLAAFEYVAWNFDKKDRMPMTELVKELRRQRFGSIATEQQYLFLHNELIEFCMRGTLYCSNENWVKWKKDYENYEPKMKTNP